MFSALTSGRILRPDVNFMQIPQANTFEAGQCDCLIASFRD